MKKEIGTKTNLMTVRKSRSWGKRGNDDNEIVAVSRESTGMGSNVHKRNGTVRYIMTRIDPLLRQLCRELTLGHQENTHEQPNIASSPIVVIMVSR